MHGTQRLTNAALGAFAQGTAHLDQTHHQLHRVFERTIDQGRLCLRQQLGVHRSRVGGQSQPDRLGHEGRERRHQQRHGLQCSMQGVEAGITIRSPLTLPEARAVAADVPVGDLVDDELLQGTTGASEIVVSQLGAHIDDRRLRARHQPTINLGARSHRRRTRGIKALAQARVVREELPRVDQRAEELAPHLEDAGGIKALGQVRGARRQQVPAHRISTVLADRGPRIDDVAQALAHLDPILVEDQAVDDASLVDRSLRKVRIRQRLHKGPDGVQRVEPAACLVEAFGDEIRGELSLCLRAPGTERPVPLRVGHRARVEPTVEHTLGATHGVTALSTRPVRLIDRRLVEVKSTGQPTRLGLQLGAAADSLFGTAAITYPERQRRAPVTIARDVPVDVVLKPLAKATAANLGRNPAHLLVELDHALFHGAGAQVPRRHGVVEERRVTAPAMRIAVRILGLAEQQAATLEVLGQALIGLLEEGALCDSADGTHQPTFGTYGLLDRQTMLARDFPVIDTIGCSLVHDAGAVLHRDVLGRVDGVQTLGIGCPRTRLDERHIRAEQRLVAQAGKGLARLDVQNLVLAQHRLCARLRDPHHFAAG